jgi:hypothetical protein
MTAISSLLNTNFLTRIAYKADCTTNTESGFLGTEDQPSKYVIASDSPAKN